MRLGRRFQPRRGFLDDNKSIFISLFDCYHQGVEPLRINELDMTLAGIFSVQKVLPNESTSWTVDYAIGSTLYRIEGHANNGRPHGTDSDVLLALQTMFFRAGCPIGDRIEVKPTDILRMAGLDTGGRAYVRLREAMLRLAGVRWSMVRSSWNETKQRHSGATSVVGIISELRLVDSGGARQPFEQRQLDERLPIEVIFSPTFADAIRAGLYQILDAELLARLQQAPARSLYRVIQAHRIQADGSLATELTVPMKDWVRACGIDESRADNARRVLALAHASLEEEGYLKGAVFSGRGFSGSVSYQFVSAPQPELAELLIARGVTRPVAESLASDHPERVQPVLGKIDAALSTGWKPRSLPASIVDGIRHPEKWTQGIPEPRSAPRKAAAPRRISAPQPEPELDVDARSIALTLIKLRLGRPLSPMGLMAFEELTDAQVQAVLAAAKRPAAEALPLLQSLLNSPL